ncbi:MAG: hypothetical protein AAFO07_27875, partial [Bacteroidota bacterium]
MKNESLKDIKTLIANNMLNEALIKIKAEPFQKDHNLISQLEKELERLFNRKSLGIISDENFILNENKIRKCLLNLVDGEIDELCFT